VIIHKTIEDNDYIPAECIISVRNSETLPLKEFADCIKKNSDVEDFEIFKSGRQSCLSQNKDNNEWTCYRLALKTRVDNDKQYLLNYTKIQATGGTGRFSTIETYFLNTETATINYLGTIPESHGDRCNDGWADIHDISKVHATVSSSATLFRLLNPDDRTNWRTKMLLSKLENNSSSNHDIELFGNLKPYDDLSNCAVCCMGKIVRILDFSGDKYKSKFAGIILDIPDYVSGQSHIEECLIEELKKLQKSNPRYLSDDWNTKIENIEMKCVTQT
jgi:hypothetical protein